MIELPNVDPEPLTGPELDAYADTPTILTHKKKSCHKYPITTQEYSYLLTHGNEFPCPNPKCSTEIGIYDLDSPFRAIVQRSLSMRSLAKLPWYHATTHDSTDDWYDFLLNHTSTKTAHLGTLPTSCDVILGRTNDPNQEVTIYQVQLDPHASLHKEVHLDDPCSISLPTQVHAYLNTYEGQGSISLLADLRSFTPTNKRTFRVEELKKIRSPYNYWNDK